MNNNRFWSHYGSTISILGGILLGCILGIIFRDGILVIEPVGDIFLNLLFTVVVPLVFFCIASAIAQIDASTSVGRLIRSTTLVFLGTVLIAALLTLIVAWCFPLRQQVLLSGDQLVPETHATPGQTITQLLTVPEFYALLSRKSMLALIVFSVGTGIAALKAGDKGEPFRAFLTSGSEVMKQLLDLVMYLAPLGLGAYFACQIGKWGGGLLGTYGQSMGLLTGVSLFYYVVFFSGYALIAGGKRALRSFWKNNILPSATAIGTSSSIATIPINLESGLKMGIPPYIAKLVIPLGGPLHKEGSAIASVVKIFLMFALFHRSLAGPGAILMVVGVSLLISVVEGGIPNGGYIGEILTVSVFGFSPAVIPPLILVGTLTDTVSTLVNATGDTVSAMLITRLVQGKRWMESNGSKALLLVSIVCCCGGAAAQNAVAQNAAPGNIVPSKNPPAVDSTLRLLHADFVFDGRDIRPDGWVLIAGNHILALSYGKRPPEGNSVPVWDFPGCTLLPGLIEGHSHLFLHPYNETSWDDQVTKESRAERTARAVTHARATLMAGFTTVRDLGTEGAMYDDVGLKHAIEKGVVPGPRMLVATRAIVATGSYGVKSESSDVEQPKGAAEADGVEGIIHEVRTQIGKGADVVKLYADYRWGPAGEARPTFTVEELRAAVSVASSSGRMVAVHAGTREGMIRAIQAGVTTIEHGQAGDDSVFRLMKARGIAYCPTVSAGEAILGYHGWRKGIDPDPDRIVQSHKSFREALASGVTILMGGDVGVFPHGDNAREMEILVEYGMTPLAVLQLATSVNAHVFGLGDSLGAIRKGYLADIIVVKGNPSIDIHAVRRVRLVMKDGLVYRKEE